MTYIEGSFLVIGVDSRSALLIRVLARADLKSVCCPAGQKFATQHTGCKPARANLEFAPTTKIEPLKCCIDFYT